MSERVIRFRGLSINGHWYMGNLAIAKKNIDHIKAGSYVSNSAGCPFAYQVRPETVGQFTGLKDKNGVEIYEGDIVLVRSQYETDEPIECPAVVSFKDGAFRTNFHFMSLTEKTASGSEGNWSHEIIGNIHENIELIKQ